MFYLRRGRSWLIWSCVAWLGLAGFGSAVEVVNGSETNRLGVLCSSGLCSVGPGVSLEWSHVEGETVSNLVDGVFVSSFVTVGGHDYRVHLGGGGVVVSDSSGRETRWFLAGFTLIMMAGLLGLSARWTSATIVGDHGLNE